MQCCDGHGNRRSCLRWRALHAGWDADDDGKKDSSDTDGDGDVDTWDTDEVRCVARNAAFFLVGLSDCPCRKHAAVAWNNRDSYLGSQALKIVQID
jgi:hypothetical protein